MSARSLPRDYRVRAQQMNAVYIAVALGTAGIALSVLNLKDVAGGVKLLIMAVILLLFGWLLWASKRCSTSADLKGIRVRRFTGSRSLRWEDVQEIRAVPNPSAGTAKNQPKFISYAYDYTGRRLQLMYLDDNHVDVAREIGLMRGAWEELRGEDWEPEPEALARMGRQESRGRKALAATGWVLGFIAVVAVISVVVIVAGG
ncbi:PH domain-containing protein [Streptomyces sp. NPDC101733]|uniref:PH domain-containing protein n=1 Tax=unclassified Streptomyces TaxID=2593676 RepID=UPI0037FE982B